MLDYNKLGHVHPKLSRGRVWCRHCGSTQAVNRGAALRSGWPKCCGCTMTIDPPEEWSKPSDAARQGVTATGPSCVPGGNNDL